MGLAPSWLLYHTLRRALRRREAGLNPPVPAGLRDAQWKALAWLAWRPGRPLLLAFGDGCALPHTLYLAGGTRLPVDARRSGRGCAHAWIRAHNVVSPALVGTMTTLVRERSTSQLHALTAGHVVAAAMAAAPGDRIVLRDDADNRSVSGKLDYWTPSFHAGRLATHVDAGLMRIGIEQARDLVDMGLSLPTGVADMRIGDTLFLQTRGIAIPARVTALCTALLTVDGGAQLQMEDGYAYDALSAPQPGDSGAPLCDEHGRIAGMHVGGGQWNGVGNGIAIPIRRALDWGNCSVLERNAPLLDLARVPLGPGPGPSGPVLGPSAGPGFVELTLARTLWGEARGEGESGMEAVACVVLNRVRRQTYWGKDVAAVCRKPYQFSCWNPTDRNSGKLNALTLLSPELGVALSIARRAIGNQLADTTMGATHYHARRLVPPPRWARGHAPCAVIGNHLFYNNID